MTTKLLLLLLSISFLVMSSYVGTTDRDTSYVLHVGGSLG